MKLKISSSDRVGISQEILSVISSHDWNLNATEVTQNETYVNIDEQGVDFSEVSQLIAKVNGVLDCQLIDMLPSEQREHHLKALLARIPDPIIDIDSNSVVVAMNEKAESVFDDRIQSLQELKLTDLLEVDELFVGNVSRSIPVNTEKGTFVADYTPLFSGNEFTGAVIVLRAINKVSRDLAILQSTTSDIDEQIIGESANIRAIKAQMIKFAELDLPVLIGGETGTGKELLAKAIHSCSPRESAPFLAINCAALPEHLLESELFGYEAGAFTGARKGGKPGLFELAENGTVFLDEVAEMSPYLQAKLLRFLEDFKFRRVGGTKELIANVRLISASHQNLTELINEKKFREDLFYRLNVLNLTLPPLRERLQDIELLVQHFVKLAAKQVNCNVPEFTKDALDELKSLEWPGNIRQLQNTLFRLVALTESSVISKRDLSLALQNVGVAVEERNFMEDNVVSWAHEQAKFERNLLKRLYPEYPTTRKLAERLSVSHNKIAMKLKEHKLV